MNFNMNARSLVNEGQHKESRWMKTRREREETKAEKSNTENMLGSDIEIIEEDKKEE